MLAEPICGGEYVPKREAFGVSKKKKNENKNKTRRPDEEKQWKQQKRKNDIEDEEKKHNLRYNILMEWCVWNVEICVRKKESKGDEKCGEKKKRK